MRVRIISPTTVSDGAGQRYDNGQVADVNDDLAAAWIAAGHAEKDSGRPATAADGKGRREATRTAPRTTSKKAAGATSSEAAKNAKADTDKSTE